MDMTQELVRGSKDVTKIERYGWLPQSAPGRFLMIHKGAIEVDHSYQRDANDPKVLIMAASWSWIGFGTATIAERDDGTFVAIDGQHRILAARRRADITMLPCMVFKLSGVPEEARAFLVANTLRKPLTGLERHKGKVQAGEAAAVELKRILDRHGYVVRTDDTGRALRAVSKATQLVQEDARVFDEVMEVLATALGGCYAHERIIGSLFYLRKRGYIDLFDKRTRSAIKRVGYEGFLAAAGRAAAYHARGGDRIWAEGVADALNKGMRTPVCTLQQGEEK